MHLASAAWGIKMLMGIANRPVGRRSSGKDCANISENLPANGSELDVGKGGTDQVFLDREMHFIQTLDGRQTVRGFLSFYRGDGGGEAFMVTDVSVELVH